MNEFRTIPLTQGQVALVDAEDYESLSRWKWHARWSEHTQSFYAVRSIWKNGRTLKVRMARQLLDAPGGIQVDHWNHDTLDNRSHNLRLATHGQNLYNCRKRRDNSSGFKGVSFHKRDQKWRADINLGGKQRSLGCFSTPVAAATAYREAAQRFHGAFACNG